jgi:DNA polymerase III delta subunit
VSAIHSVAQGNALALLSLVNDMGKQPAGFAALRSVVTDAGGAVVKVDLPRDIVGWIREIGPSLGARLDGPAAQELARRIGALEKGGDVDRRALASAAAAELGKLALYRPDGEVTAADVAAVVAERLPASLFRLVDAIGARRAQEAMMLLDRASTTPPPVLVARIHRRLHDIAIARDLASRREPGIAIARALGWLPAKTGPRRTDAGGASAAPDLGKVEWRVDRIVDEARRWTDDELASALDGLLAADAAMKGERSSSERAQRLELALWVVERVAAR